MKSLTLFLLIMGLIVYGCTSSAQTSKKESKKNSKKEMKKEEEKKVKEEELKKAEEQRQAKLEEEKRVKEELEKKREESEKQKEELRRVQENLKKMGLAALHVEFTKENTVLKYTSGQTLTLGAGVKDQVILDKLNDLLQKAREKESKTERAGGWCYGGYEACHDGKLYIYVNTMIGTNCTGEWYGTNAECK